MIDSVRSGKIGEPQLLIANLTRVLVSQNGTFAWVRVNLSIPNSAKRIVSRPFLCRGVVHVGMNPNIFRR